MPVSAKVSAETLQLANEAPSIMHAAKATPTTRRIPRFLQFTAVLWCIAISHPATLKAQFTSEPQALTYEEYDQYLSVLSPTDPSAVVKAGESFEKAYPSSALLPKVYRMELDAWKAMGDARQAILAGKKALQLVPENVDVMSELAYLIADTESNPASLKEAKAYGAGTIEFLDKLQIPRSISPQAWKPLRGSIEGRAHSALGLVAFKSGFLKESITEFELSLQTGAVDEAATFYRLGISYHLAGFEEKARSCLTRAAASNDPEIRRRAEQELGKLPR
jgi:tetratricopeptide (TPR) repeat protein